MDTDTNHNDNDDTNADDNNGPRYNGYRSALMYIIIIIISILLLLLLLLLLSVPNDSRSSALATNTPTFRQCLF